MNFRIPQIILALAILTPYASLSSHKPRWDAFCLLTSSALLVINFPLAKLSRVSV